jgi:hypothetical protein
VYCDENDRVEFYMNHTVRRNGEFDARWHLYESDGEIELGDSFDDASYVKEITEALIAKIAEAELLGDYSTIYLKCTDLTITIVEEI